MLEKAVRQVLDLIGFKTQSFDDGESEFDVIFKSKEGRLLGEVEGRDSKAINVGKFSQLLRNIGEDLEKSDVETPAKGVLFGNGYRFIEIEKREELFTKKCITSAEASNFALVKTPDLFYIYNKLSSKKDASYSKKCREAILNSKGIVKFPK